MSNSCQKCNGIFTDQTACNPFKNNAIFRAKYRALACQVLSVAEAIDVYVGVLSETLAGNQSSTPESLADNDLVAETETILNKMNGLIPCVHLRSNDGSVITNWVADFSTNAATGLFVLTPPCPCGLGTFTVHCCRLVVTQNLSNPDSVSLTQDYIDQWCCTSQHLRAIASFINDYFC